MVSHGHFLIRPTGPAATCIFPWQRLRISGRRGHEWTSWCAWRFTTNKGTRRRRPALRLACGHTNGEDERLTTLSVHYAGTRACTGEYGLTLSLLHGLRDALRLRFGARTLLALTGGRGCERMLALGGNPVDFSLSSLGFVFSSLLFLAAIFSRPGEGGHAFTSRTREASKPRSFFGRQDGGGRGLLTLFISFME